MHEKMYFTGSSSANTENMMTIFPIWNIEKEEKLFFHEILLGMLYKNVSVVEREREKLSKSKIQLSWVVTCLANNERKKSIWTVWNKTRVEN